MVEEPPHLMWCPNITHLRCIHTVYCIMAGGKAQCYTSFLCAERHNNAKHASDVLSETLVVFVFFKSAPVHCDVRRGREWGGKISHDMKRKKKKACGGSRLRGPNDLKEILCKHLRPRTFLSVIFHFINGIQTCNFRRSVNASSTQG